MAISVDCTSCGRKFRAKDAYRGRRLKCPGCAQEMLIDGPDVPDHDVFVSHSSKDKTVADAVCAALEAKGVRCWIAPRDIPAGATWGSAIIDAIEESRVMVLVFSSRANASQQVLREVERAVAKGLAILPLRVEDVTMSKDLEYFLSTSHWMDATVEPMAEHLKQLSRRVRALLGEMEGGSNEGARADGAPGPATAPGFAGAAAEPEQLGALAQAVALAAGVDGPSDRAGGWRDDSGTATPFTGGQAGPSGSSLSPSRLGPRTKWVVVAGVIAVLSGVAAAIALWPGENGTGHKTTTRPEVTVAEVVELKSAADQGWAAVRSLDRDQGFGKDLDAVDRQINAARELDARKELASAAEAYRRAGEMAAELRRRQALREQAAAARDAAVGAESAARAAGAERNAASAWKDADRFASDGAKAFKGGDFLNAAGRWRQAVTRYETARTAASKIARTRVARDAKPRFELALASCDADRLSRFGGSAWAEVQSALEPMLRQANGAGPTTEDVATAYNRAAELLPQAAEAANAACVADLWERAKDSERRGDFAKALSALAELLQIDGEHSEAKAMHGRLQEVSDPLWWLEKAKLAAEALPGREEHRASRSEAYYQIALLQARAGAADRAVATAEQMIASVHYRSYREAMSYEDIAVIQLELGDIQGAEATGAHFGLKGPRFLIELARAKGASDPGAAGAALALAERKYSLGAYEYSQIALNSRS